MKKIIYLICISFIVTPLAFSQEEKMGLTWGKIKHDQERYIDLVGCYGKPKPAGSDACDARTGDTPCDRSLPILCINKDGSPRPDYSLENKGHKLAKEYYRGWAEGDIMLTPPIKGSDITSLDHADSLCRDWLGDGYQMAEFHDGRWIKGMGPDKYYGDTWPENTNESGWNFWAYGNVGDESRFWVYIRDQQANCWTENPVKQNESYKQDTEKGDMELILTNDPVKQDEPDRKHIEKEHKESWISFKNIESIVLFIITVMIIGLAINHAKKSDGERNVVSVFLEGLAFTAGWIVSLFIIGYALSILNQLGFRDDWGVLNILYFVFIGIPIFVAYPVIYFMSRAVTDNRLKALISAVILSPLTIIGLIGTLWAFAMLAHLINR
jgi:hypothetical protein